MWLERITGGGADLIDLQDAKNYLRILVDDFDVDVASAISSASIVLDVDENGFGGLGFPLLSQQWVSKGSALNAQLLRLPFSRIASVDEISFTRPDGSTGIVPAQDYQLAKQGREWSVVAAQGLAWPQAQIGRGSVQIKFTAGWEAIGDIPADIKEAARLLVRAFFEGGADFGEEDLPESIGNAVDRLTRRYRRFAI